MHLDLTWTWIGVMDTVEPRLMRAMIEAVKQHRLRREREEIDKGDWAEGGAEGLSLRPTWRTAHPPSVRKASAMVNRGGDGSEFALFVATLLQSIGAHVRAYTHSRIYIHAHIHTHMHTCMHTFTYIHTFTHIHTRTHTHTYTH